MCEVVEDYRHTKDGRKKFLLDNGIHSRERGSYTNEGIVREYFRLGMSGVKIKKRFIYSLDYLFADMLTT